LEYVDYQGATIKAASVFRNANSIDALRGIAALAVVIMHARLLLWIGVGETWLSNGFSLDFWAWLGYLSTPFMFGYLGVPLFFVISGYCIHMRGAKNLVASQSATLDVRQFYLRRISRLYPTYFAILCLTAAVDYWLLSVDGHDIVRLDQIDNSLATFFTSLLGLQGILAPTFGSNGVFWTLSIELHLYIVYPLLFLMSKFMGAGKTLVITLIASLAYIFVDNRLGIRAHLPSNDGIGPIFLSYWFVWTLGMYIAEVKVGRARLFPLFAPICIASALLYFVSYFWVRVLDPPLSNFSAYEMITTTSIGIAFAGVLHFSTNSWKTRLESIGIVRALSLIGAFSYSLYAVHVPVLLVCRYFFIGNISSETLGPAIIGVISSLAAALLLFLVVEVRSVRIPTTATK
jgi:peptidoglycan/LPS O-acetylase OafA/YrhL